MINLIIIVVLVASVVFGGSGNAFKVTLRAHKIPQEPPIMMLYLKCDAPYFDPKQWCPIVSISSDTIVKSSWCFPVFLEAQPLHMHSRAMWRNFHGEQPQMMVLWGLNGWFLSHENLLPFQGNFIIRFWHKNIHLIIFLFLI